MDIICHTASMIPSIENLNVLKNNPLYTRIELDFRYTKDYHLVWSHSNMLHSKRISDSRLSELEEAISLTDVLECLNHKKDILIEIKDPPKKVILDYTILTQSLDCLRYYQKNVQLESFNQELINRILCLQEVGSFDFLDVGLIINLFKTFRYRNRFPDNLKKIDFISLSNELFEWLMVGEDYLRYRKMLPNVLEYAWSWDAVYQENEGRIRHYLDCGVDGIITIKPQLVKTCTQTFCK